MAKQKMQSVAGGRQIPCFQNWQEMCAYYGNKCLCCKRADVALTRDHVLPLALGGPNRLRNYQPLCQPCNAAKAGDWIDYRFDPPIHYKRKTQRLWRKKLGLQ